MKNFICFVLTLILISFISCREKVEGDEKEIDTTAITIAILPTYDCMPFYYAQEEGLFDSLNVNVRLLNYESSMDADTAFARGTAIGVMSDIIKASIWQSNGDSIKVVMATDPDISLVTSKGARIFNTKNIKEKIIAITRHSILDFITDKILEKEKLKSEDLNKPQINNIKLRTKMTDQNQLDGALLTEPYASEATKVWGGKLLTSSSKLGLHYMATLVFNDSTLNKRAEDIKKIVSAYKIATEELNKRKSKILRYIPKESSVEIDDTLYEYKSIPSPALPSDSLLQIVNKWTIERKLTKNVTSYFALVDSTFIKE